MVPDWGKKWEQVLAAPLPTTTLAITPAPQLLMIFRNGQMLTLNSDYARRGALIDFTLGNVPQAGDVISIWY